MFYKIKGFIFLILLILLQSCSGGRLGDFLELSFDNLENKTDKNPQKDLSREKSLVQAKKSSKGKNSQENPQKDLSREKSLVQAKKSSKDKNSLENLKNDLQSYKIIFILKDVDPKDPIKELSTILSNSKVNFEIEKIERFFDSKNKNMKKTY